MKFEKCKLISCSGLLKIIKSKKIKLTLKRQKGEIIIQRTLNRTWIRPTFIFLLFQLVVTVRPTDLRYMNILKQR